jgi:hypothetical protein
MLHALRDTEMQCYLSASVTSLFNCTLIQYKGEDVDGTSTVMRYPRPCITALRYTSKMSHTTW